MAAAQWLRAVPQWLGVGLCGVVIADYLCPEIGSRGWRRLCAIIIVLAAAARGARRPRGTVPGAAATPAPLTPRPRESSAGRASPPHARGRRVRSPQPRPTPVDDDALGEGAVVVAERRHAASPGPLRRRPPGSGAAGCEARGAGGLAEGGAPIDWEEDPVWPPRHYCDAAGNQIRSGQFDLSPEDVRSRNQLRRLAREGGLYPIPDRQKLSDDDVLTRFLIARKFSVPAALEMLRASVQMRQQLELDPPAVYARASARLRVDVSELFPVGYYGRDRDGLPVYWSRPDPAQCARLAAAYDSSAIIFWVFCIVERGREICRRLGVDRWTAVTDLSLLSVRALFGPAGKLLVEQAARVQSIYPEMVRHSILINCPSSFNAIWRIIRPVLDQRVQDKVRVQPVLSDYVAPEMTPPEFGGCAPVRLSDVIITPAQSGELDLRRIGCAS
eukprot:TRINITY_DN66398_c0_g1_i1.p1 TRINITY_DN66398_c0_g1~~TRINITY_DN66398_c0_g1_i1.p1  ORF type:complete len:473 (+),score=135.15 TRINITY_DN66398_c0_g1_i1:88-1419(+)